MIVLDDYTGLPVLPPGHSAAYADGWSDAVAGEPMPAGCSPAYASGYSDYLAAHRDAC